MPVMTDRKNPKGSEENYESESSKTDPEPEASKAPEKSESEMTIAPVKTDSEAPAAPEKSESETTVVPVKTDQAPDASLRSEPEPSTTVNKSDEPKPTTPLKKKKISENMQSADEDDNDDCLDNVGWWHFSFKQLIAVFIIVNYFVCTKEVMDLASLLMTGIWDLIQSTVCVGINWYSRKFFNVSGNNGSFLSYSNNSSPSFYPTGTCPLGGNQTFVEDQEYQDLEKQKWCQPNEEIVTPDFGMALFLIYQNFLKGFTSLGFEVWTMTYYCLTFICGSLRLVITTFASFIVTFYIFRILIKVLKTLGDKPDTSFFSKWKSPKNKKTSLKQSGTTTEGKKAVNSTTDTCRRQNREDLSSSLSSLLNNLGLSFEIGDGFGSSEGSSSKYKSDITLKDYKGGSEAKKELELVVDFLKNPAKYHDLGARLPRGVLLYGPPGTGKTLFARALAGEAGVAFLHKCASEFRGMLVGSGARNISNIFAKARKCAPCILFIDEIDSISKRTTSSHHPYANQAINQILHEMDGFVKNESDVIVVGATNRLDNLDQAILRPGRFDKVVHVDLPDFSSRKDILEYYVGRLKKVGEVDAAAIALKTDECSGADLECIVNEAAIVAACAGAERVEQQHLVTAIEQRKKSRDKMEKYDSYNHKPNRDAMHMYN